MSLCYGMKDGKLQTYNDGYVKTAEDVESEVHEDLAREKESCDKEDDGILLSKEHGVNPSISTCLLCGKDVGIILFGRLEGDKEAPKKCCVGELCDECKEKLLADKELVILDDTGRYVIVSEEYLTPEGRKLISNTRVLFVTSETFDNRVIENENN